LRAEDGRYIRHSSTPRRKCGKQWQKWKESKRELGVKFDVGICSSAEKETHWAVFHSVDTTGAWELMTLQTLVQERDRKERQHSMESVREMIREILDIQRKKTGL
jgi:hypothetical protein